eukprot:GHVU01168017.1.p1 GENE.GHVU01168017.1~~GHVU01168017.1.p1  ORF type:complete len:262 (+),score=59.03 GHVU01168017.1:648-1433(+)
MAAADMRDQRMVYSCRSDGGRTSFDLLEIVDIAEEAGRRIMDIYGSDDFNVEYKDDKSPLTRADKEANEIICRRLLAVAPHVPIVSEENRSIEFGTRRSFPCHWCVDPLDGTKEFIKRNGQFTVNIGFVEAGEPTAGVVVVPTQGQSYYAARGLGAFKKEPEDKEKKSAAALPGGGGGGGGGGEGSQAPRYRTSPITAACFREDAPGLTVIASGSHATAMTTKFINKFKDPKTISLGSVGGLVGTVGGVPVGMGHSGCVGS